MKKLILVCSGVTILILISMFVIWLNYAPIIDYPIHELQYIEISYRVDAEDYKYPEYQKMIIEDETEKQFIYNMLKRAKLEDVDRLCGDEAGSDSRWCLSLHFHDAVEEYTPDVYSMEYGCRKYIRNKKDGSVEGMLIISSRELFHEIEKNIENEKRRDETGKLFRRGGILPLWKKYPRRATLQAFHPGVRQAPRRW